eukprot:TRINITY_DN3966_c0_g1_i2.p1 TRINITY_DN3966_c0_g1~~TRINITY_DN3966_c0_g1_i2.p1  ORF type:complete len:169 (+),score=32.85 TRINITY_DN3966_c0_g1_i2:477-983(+)
MGEKFHGWMIQHRDKQISDWFGNFTEYSSPLTACPLLEYSSIKGDFRSDHAPSKLGQVSPYFQKLLQILLGKPVTEEDLEVSRDDVKLDNDPNYVQKMLDILTATRFIIPGEYSGSNSIYLMRRFQVTTGEILKVITRDFPEQCKFAPETFPNVFLPVKAKVGMESGS